jgi:transcriptional regulator with XRE-family HTH domain
MKSISGSEAKSLRTARGASQADVSAALGINRTYYSLFENGRYTLTDEQQSQLAEFLEFEAARGEPPSPGNTDSPQQVADALNTDDDEAHDEDDPRVIAASDALNNVRETATATGIDSKRTATAVAAAAAALDWLDYSELLALDHDSKPVLAGAPDEKTFAEIGSLDEKQTWEKRVASSLICAELYGDTWTACKCGALREAQRHISRKVDNGESLGIRAGGVLWDDAEDHPHIRNELAPHIVRAAQLRLAPQLAPEKAPRQAESRGTFF